MRVTFRGAGAAIVFARSIAQPRPVGSLFLATEISFGSPATNAQVEVIVMGVTVRRLMKNPGGSSQGLRRAFMTRRISQEADLELIGAEEPLHTRALVHDQRAHEAPIAGLVELECMTAQHREAKSIELQPAITTHWQAASVSRKEQQVGIASNAVRAMPGMRASVCVRQITNAKRVASWKSVGYFTGHPFDRVNQRCGPVSGALPGTQPRIANAAVRETEPPMEIPVVHSPA